MSLLFIPLLILAFIVIFIIMIGFSMLRSILSLFFPFLRRKQSNPFGGFAQGSNPFGTNQSHTERAEQENPHRTHNRKKIFEANDGDYVEFEEVKE